jgi:DeoR/GlpR family transcriptional regulator of sugar metabolism
MKRALASRAAETYVLASSEKIGTASRYTVLDFGDVAGIITDTDHRNQTIKALAATGTTVIEAA